MRQHLHHISGRVSHILVTELTMPSTSLQKGNIFSGTCCRKQMQDCSAWDCAKAMCQDRARTVSKSTQALDPWNGSQQCSPAAFCLVWQFGDSFTSTMLWKPMDFHAYLGQGEGPKITKFGFYCVLHLLLQRYEPGPLHSASQQVVGTWRCWSSEPLTIFLQSFLS